MDPDVTLRDIRAALRKLEVTDHDMDEVDTLVDRVTALDDWFTQGGFLPDAWKKACQ